MSLVWSVKKEFARRRCPIERQQTLVSFLLWFTGASAGDAYLVSLCSAQEQTHAVPLVQPTSGSALAYSSRGAASKYLNKAGHNQPSMPNVGEKYQFPPESSRRHSSFAA